MSEQLTFTNLDAGLTKSEVQERARIAAESDTNELESNHYDRPTINEIEPSSDDLDIIDVSRNDSAQLNIEFVDTDEVPIPVIERKKENFDPAREERLAKIARQITLESMPVEHWTSTANK